MATAGRLKPAPPGAGGALSALIRVRRGRLEVEVELRAGAGETLALLGPNGAGKTTVVRALAGLLPLDGGRVELDGQVLEEAGGARLAPEHRPVGVVFQEDLLFPHMSALDNAAYGVPGPRGAARQEALAILARLAVAEVASLTPRQLSGGQRQRVALARALARRPRLLLLDEPLGALDVQARPAARAYLGEALAGFDGVTVLVTHDTVDAMTLAGRIAVIEAGRVTQSGTTAEIAAHPRSRYVADFVGLNLFRGRASAGVIRAAAGAIHVAGDVEGEVFAVLHPRAVTLHRAQPDGSARNTWRLAVGGLEVSADRARVALSGEIDLVAEVTLGAVEDLHLRDGGQVWAEAKATAFDVYPA